MALTSEVNNLQKKLRLDSNSTKATEIAELQRELEEKSAELNVKKQQIEQNVANSTLILQIISLQSQIWDLQQTQSRQSDRRILALQEQLDRKIAELRGSAAVPSAMLELISVRQKITAIQKTISLYFEESRTNVADVQMQLRRKTELLKKKIMQLSRDENNKQLTREILVLQGELDQLDKLVVNTTKTTDYQIQEIRVLLEEQRKRQIILQKQLEEADYPQAQLIMKLISIMEEVREQQLTTSTAQTNSLLQAKEKEYAKAQAEIRDLQRKLELKNKTCSGPETRYEQVKTEYEQKIAELNRTGDSTVALILNVIKLRDEVKALREEISSSDDPDKISELQSQLQKKQRELDSKTEDIEKLNDNPRTVLTIIELQEEIWDLQKKAANGPTSGNLKKLQNRLDGLLGEIDDQDGSNTQLMLRIIFLQSQIKHLERQLSNPHMPQNTTATQLQNDLASKKTKLENYVSKLNEKNPTAAKLILSIAGLHSQLRNLEKAKPTESQTASATISKLREQLKNKEEEHSRDQAVIGALQNKLNQTEAQCSEQKIKELQNNLDTKITELQSKSDTVSSLALQITTLTLQVDELKRQLQNTESKSKVEELQKIIDEKTKELDKKTEELRKRSLQPQRLLQIISIQTEIEKLASVAANDTDYDKIRAYQDHLNYLINEIQDENSENTKLMFQFMAQRDEIARLKKQEESQLQAQVEKIKDLEDKLEDIRNQIKEKTHMLDSSDMRISNQSAQIMELHGKIEPLEDKISSLKKNHAEDLAELQERLNFTSRQLQVSEVQLQQADTKNFNLITEIADLRGQLKKAKKKASEVSGKNINDLEQQLRTQQRENTKLERANKDLTQDIQQLRKCCSDVKPLCDDLERQLQQSQEDADRLQKQLHDKDATLKQLDQELQERTKENNQLQHEKSNLMLQLQQREDDAQHQQQQLHESDARLRQLEHNLDEQTNENKKLLEDYNNLQNEKNKLENDLEELQKQQEDVEDQTIYATKTTFDPDTANSRVVLSADNTEMSTTDSTQNVPDHLGRFDVILAALGATGYSSGRHYWEVSVAGKSCFHIGMASESAPRRGSFTFNPTRGFWTIVLNKQGQYRALDRRSVPIVCPTQPLTLGVLLDYKKGQISFYDAGARSHLYSFVGQTFTDKIYPFVNFCVENTANPNPIVLLSPGSVDWIK
ncbi:myosin heavy chain, fast skeletal muscle [Stegastes partitus]|uniref:Myosin heavy chain, fast skeletal muscle n=1 Tax=Stegastes partitus TaxID=144197 RepID=A0A9Y4N289_9TELE|nr:PREDICTED: myosin heavy chain, fast skeletal muscle-like [Stegastes partitus]